MNPQYAHIGIVCAVVWCGIISVAAKKPILPIPDSLQVLTFQVGEQVITMQRVEGGVFTMGATPEQQSDPIASDQPMHTVAVSPFYIGTTEVTNALWQTVMPEWNKINEWEDPLKPVSWVSWEDCQLFIERLNILTNSTAHGSRVGVCCPRWKPRTQLPLCRWQHRRQCQLGTQQCGQPEAPRGTAAAQRTGVV